MLLKSELAVASDIPVLDDDPALFDPDPDWADELSLAALDDDDFEDLGLRAVIERPEALSEAWKQTRREERTRRGAARSKIRRRKRSMH